LAIHVFIDVATRIVSFGITDKACFVKYCGEPRRESPARRVDRFTLRSQCHMIEIKARLMSSTPKRYSGESDKDLRQSGF
jgi:hypothetical protein